MRVIPAGPPSAATSPTRESAAREKLHADREHQQQHDADLREELHRMRVRDRRSRRELPTTMFSQHVADDQRLATELRESRTTQSGEEEEAQVDEKPVSSTQNAYHARRNDEWARGLSLPGAFVYSLTTCRP